jgi:hypothetical protein
MEEVNEQSMNGNKKITRENSSKIILFNLRPYLTQLKRM